MQVIKKYYKGTTLVVLLMALGLIIGCDWTSGGSGFNTSRGRADINFSGTYRGHLDGGRVVSRTSGGPIVRLVISQQGDALEVLDNNGSVYRGRIGAVSTVTVTGDTDAFNEGDQLAQAQVSWSGHDNVAARSIEFVGNISVVAATQITGTTSESSSSDISTGRTESEVVDGNRVTITITEVIEEAGALEETVIVIVRDRISGEELSRTTETRTLSSRSNNFILTSQNTQYHLQGTWVESGGVVSEVSALAAGSAGRIGTAEDREAGVGSGASN